MKRLLSTIVVAIACLCAATAHADLTCVGEAAPRILFLHSITAEKVWIAGFLTAHPDLGTATYFDLQQGTPTAADFANVDLVIAITDYPVANPAAAGDALAAFAQNHPVILNAVAVDTADMFAITGGMVALRPAVTSSAAESWAIVSMGVRYAAHPALAGVTSDTEIFHMAGAVLAQGAEPAAFYGDAASSVMLAQLGNVYFFNSALNDNFITTTNETILYNIIKHLWCKQDRPIKAAVLEDSVPWAGAGAMERYLENRRVPTDKIASANFGAADLSGYDFVVIGGNQLAAFYTALAADAAWLEAWVAAGGILLFNSATLSTEWPTGLTLPTGIQETYALANAVNVHLPAHKLVTYPYDASANGYYDNWGETIYGYYAAYNGGNGGEEVIRMSDNGHATLVHYPFGHGHVIANATAVDCRMGDAPCAPNDWFFGEDLLSYLPPIADGLDVAAGNVGDNPRRTGVAGFNFWLDGSTTVAAIPSGSKLASLPVSNLAVDSSTHLSFDLDLTNTQCGAYSVVVGTPLGTSTATTAFTIETPTIVINTATPNAANVGDTVTVGVFGNYFLDQNLTVQLTGPATIDGTNIDIAAETALTVDFHLSGAVHGTYDLTIANNCNTGTKASAFTVDDDDDNDNDDNDDNDDDTAADDDNDTAADDDNDTADDDDDDDDNDNDDSVDDDDDDDDDSADDDDDAADDDNDSADDDNDTADDDNDTTDDDATPVHHAGSSAKSGCGC